MENSHGVTITHGMEVSSLRVQRGDTIRELTGTVRNFTDEFGVERWEVLTDDPKYPAIGFIPENVVSTSSD